MKRMRKFKMLLPGFGLILLILLFNFKHATGQLNMTAYRLMPPLYIYDDYDGCLEKERAAYCVVHIEINPDESNRIWQEIDSFSSDFKRHYRHDYLKYGVCLERCTMKWQALKVDANNDQLASEKDFRYNDIVEHFKLVYGLRENLNDRREYGGVLNACLNGEFQEKYNLSVKTFVKYCEKSQDVKVSENPETDLGESVAYVVFGSILLLVVLSSLYDMVLKIQVKSKRSISAVEFYRMKHESPLREILTAFSICRNYYVLTKPPKSPLSQELSCFDGVRTLSMLIVVFSHVLVLHMDGPVRNPEFYETVYHGKLMGLFVGATPLMQTYFCLTGFLLFVNFKARQLVTDRTSTKGALRLWAILIGQRYIRLMLSIVLVMMFSATLLNNLSTGPFWKQFVQQEQEFCRRNWWMVLTTLNNNYSHKETCVQQTWYTSTDIHLFVIFSIVLIVISRYPKSKVAIYTVLAIISSGINPLVTYIHQMSGFVYVYPETYRNLYFRGVTEIYESYMPFYTNMNGYLYGFLAGEIYMKMRAAAKSQSKSVDKMIPKNSLVHCLWWAAFLSYFGLACAGYYFTENDIVHPSAIDLLNAALARMAWSIVTAATLIGLALKAGWFAYDMFCSPLFQVLGRISYQSFLWHVIVFRLMVVNHREPVNVNWGTIVFSYVALYTLSHILAFFLAMFFEYPLHTVVKTLFEFQKGASKKPLTTDCNQDDESSKLKTG